jgi:hypothetical protein
MKSRYVSLGLLTLLSSLTVSLPQVVQAQVTTAPALLNFQGRLTRPDGTPVADGTYSVRFSLWNALSGGTEKWNQTLSALMVRNGTFATLLGGFPDGTFNSNLWMEIKIGTAVPLTPRQQLVSVAYAMKANSVPDGSIGAAQIANGAITSDKLANSALSWLLKGNSGTSASHFLGTTDNQPLVFRTNNAERMRLLTNGNLGLGTATPGFPLNFPNSLGDKISLFGQSGAHYGFGIQGSQLQIHTDGAHADVVFGYGSSAAMTESARIKGTGEIIAKVVTVTGGSDVAEPYNVAPAGDIKAIPGMLVSIDPDKVGQMRVASRVYDTTVAGIVSGANGIHPGITLRQTGTVADGELPVASIGRVWCWCDADANGAIKAGDLLTSSDTPGHAMKATDRERRDGAVIGKAMSGLPSGKGLVLVLVSLK